MIFYTTFTTQVELLPRLTILYGKTENDGIENKRGIAIEWLWFGVFIGN